MRIRAMYWIFPSFFLVFALLGVARAQSLSNGTPTAAVSSSEDTDVTRGADLWKELQTRERSCADVTQQDYELLGEYVMAQHLGDQHDAMDQAMDQMMGTQGTEQMHIVMGERFSGCVSAAGSFGYSMMGYGAYPGVGMMGGWIGNPLPQRMVSWAPFGVDSSWAMLAAVWAVLLLPWIAVIFLAAILMRSRKKHQPHPSKEKF